MSPFHYGVWRGDWTKGATVRTGGGGGVCMEINIFVGKMGEIIGHKAWWKYSLSWGEKNKAVHLPCDINKTGQAKTPPLPAMEISNGIAPWWIKKCLYKSREFAGGRGGGHFLPRYLPMGEGRYGFTAACERSISPSHVVPQHYSHMSAPQKSAAMTCILYSKSGQSRGRSWFVRQVVIPVWRH